MPSSRSFNLIVLVVILLGAALLGRGLMGTSDREVQSLGRELQDALRRVNPEGAPVVRPLIGSTAVDVEIDVQPQPRPSRGVWAYSVARFVAARHPQVKLGNLNVVDLGLKTKLDETPMAGGNLADPAYRALARSEVLRRTAQSMLDANWAGKGLILVDVQMGPKPVSVARMARVFGNRVGATGEGEGHKVEGPPEAPARDTSEYERVRAPEGVNPRSARHIGADISGASREMASPRPNLEAQESTRVDTVLLWAGDEASAQKAQATCRDSLQLNAARGDSIRLVILSPGK